MTQDHLNRILAAHEEWLADHTKGERADLHSANLSGLSLKGRKLSGAILHDVNLTNCDCSDAGTDPKTKQPIRTEFLEVDGEPTDLTRANLSKANLTKADFTGATLTLANFYKSICSSTKFNSTDLVKANFTEASLRSANFTSANLTEAIFTRSDKGTSSDLKSANFNSATITDADFHTVKNFSNIRNFPNIPIVCKAEGIIERCYKKAYYETEDGQKIPKIVVLRIPNDAIRLSGTSRKCRANKAEVIELLNIDGSIARELETDPTTGIKGFKKITKVKSYHDDTFTYEIYDTTPKTYQTVTLKSGETFDTNRWNDCGNGIHFFTTFDEAVAYEFNKPVRLEG